ncbi:MAG: hypothetical protein IJ228_05885 [Succinivibrio sp.]|nr:hypothetical protein [Succinivibrio sp.]
MNKPHYPWLPLILSGGLLLISACDQAPAPAPKPVELQNELAISVPQGWEHSGSAALGSAADIYTLSNPQFKSECTLSLSYVETRPDYGADFEGKVLSSAQNLRDYLQGSYDQQSNVRNRITDLQIPTAANYPGYFFVVDTLSLQDKLLERSVNYISLLREGLLLTAHLSDKSGRAEGKCLNSLNTALQTLTFRGVPVYGSKRAEQGEEGAVNGSATAPLQAPSQDKAP